MGVKLKSTHQFGNWSSYDVSLDGAKIGDVQREPYGGWFATPTNPWNGAYGGGYRTRRQAVAALVAGKDDVEQPE